MLKTSLSSSFTAVGGSDSSKTNVTMSTFAGSGTQGSADGTGTAASFDIPYSIAVDSSGTLFITELSNRKIRKITSAGVVTTLAGSGSQSSTDGAGTAASFFIPAGIAIDTSGNLFGADGQGNTPKIRKITSSGVVTTFAGSGIPGSTDATGTTASFNTPVGIALDSSGTLFVTESVNRKIRKITSAGVVTTFAGSGSSSSIDGTGTGASFIAPLGIAIDTSGNVYVSDGNSISTSLRKITPSGVVSTLDIRNTDGTSIYLGITYGLIIDNSGTLFVSSYSRNTIYMITSSNVMTTLAGNTIPGSTDGAGTVARFNSPNVLTMDSSGAIYVADSGNNKIRKIVCN